VYPGLALIGLGALGVAALLPGPLDVAGVFVLDIHTFTVAAVAILIGLQIVSFGVVARRFASAKGLLPRPERYAGLFAWLTLERGLIVAGLVVGAGLIGVLWAVATWAARDFGPLTDPRIVRVLMLSMTAIAAGVQLTFTSFLAGLMDLPVRPDEDK